MTVPHLTQEAIETLTQADPNARLTQAATEVASQGTHSPSASRC
jgi:hypothetical protein